MEQGQVARNGILKSLRAIKQWLATAKSVLIDKAQVIGEQEETIDQLEAMFSTMDIPPSPSPTVDLVDSLSTYIESKKAYLWSMDPEDPGSYWDAPFIATSGSAVIGTSSTFILTPDLDSRQYTSKFSILREVWCTPKVVPC